MPKTFGSAGPRSIYPDLCDSRSLSRCSILANALWPRLIVQADDQGRLHGDAQDVRGLCFPKMDVADADVETALGELASVGSIRRYERRGEPYIQLLDWWSYQSFMRRAYPSRYPAPSGWRDVIYGVDASPATYKLASAANRGTLPRNAANRGESPPTLVDPSRVDPSRVDPSTPRPSARRRAASGHDDVETTGDGVAKAKLVAAGLRALS